MTDRYESRRMMGSDMFERWQSTETDQRQGVPHPLVQKPAPEGALLIDLPAPETFNFDGVSVLEAIRSRRSRREYLPQELTLSELAFLCWATQGVRQADSNEVRLMRTVPSAGARHPFETYLAVLRVEGLAVGLYRYLGVEHKLCLLEPDAEIGEKFARACAPFARGSAVTFAWTAIPYRTEWRYAYASPKLVMQDSGHVSQNLYLACEAIGCGTCAVSAYWQHGMDELLGLDGETEFTVYCAPVGKVAG
jgi:SagB-type dehydrogenase family enzyme